MVRRMRETVEAGQASSLAARLDTLTSKDIHQAALDGDAAARENIEQTGRYLGIGVSNILHILNPAVVTFSGGPTAAGEMLMAPLLDEVGRRTLEASRQEVKIAFAEFPVTAGVIGAARLQMLG